MNASEPPPDLLQAVADLAGRGGGFAVAVVLSAAGSTPCKAGARAILAAGGTLQGTIGGGVVEAEAQRRAGEAIASGRPTVIGLDLDGSRPGDDRPVCGGTMRVLVDPTASRHRAAFAEAAALRRRRERGVLLTTVRGAGPWAVAVQCQRAAALPPASGFPGIEPELRAATGESEARCGSRSRQTSGATAVSALNSGEVSYGPACNLGEAVRSVLQREQAASVLSEPPAAGERVEVLIEPLIPPPVLVIVGGGHVGQAVAVQARLAGFEIVVLDDRPAFTDSALFPREATIRCGPIGEEVAHYPIDSDTYVVIATRSHAHDAEALAASLRQPARYIGMIGSRRKVAHLRREFVEAGRSTAAEFDRLYAPIGLDIGAATVPEIATSIVAQLIAVRRKGRG